TVPWPLAPQSKPRSLSKTFCRTFSTLSNLQGQAAFKRRFHGVEEPTYLAFRKGTFFEALSLLRLIRAV
ncbi:hypothetical protein NKH60_22600, partial [Mesorhizobium sp. M1006]